MATERWRWQDDSTSSFLAAATLPDESVVVAGNVESSSGNKEDFVAMRLNPSDGRFLWKWQVLAVLQILGRGNCYHDVCQMSYMSESAVCQTFHTFCRLFAEELYDEYIRLPVGPEHERVMEHYHRVGFTGAVGSTDVTHVRWDSCPFSMQRSYTGKEGYPTLAYQATVDHTGRVLGVTPGFAGAQNDKIIARFDPTIEQVRDNPLYRDKEFSLRRKDGSLLTVKGNYLIVDNGYHKEKSSEDDVIAGAAAGSDGSVVLSGFTLGNWSGVSGGREDYAAVKLNQDGEVVWRLQGGSGGGDGFFSVAVGGDESAFLGGTVSESFHLMKVDTDGNVEWEWTGDSGEQDQGIAVVFSGGDNSAVLAGTTGGDWAGAFAGGSSDFAAVKVDPDGQGKWRWQDGTEEADCVLSAVEAEDGSIIMSGWTKGSFASPNAGKEDFVAIKLDADGTELWRWQDGTFGNDQIWASTMVEDGSVVMGGFTYGNWSGENRGWGDFMAVKLDALDGSSEAWRWQDGTHGDDFIVAITLVSSGLMAFAGCTKRSSDRSHPGDFEQGVVLMIDTSLSRRQPPPASSLLDIPPFPIVTEVIVISAAAMALIALAFCRRRIRACRLRALNSLVDTVKHTGDDEVNVVAGRGGKHASAYSYVTD